MVVPPGMQGSVENLLHKDSAEDKIIILDDEKWKDRLNKYLPHRAIGVVYNPGSERGNYLLSQIPSRYDALIYIDKSTALHPIHHKDNVTEIPETYPFGL
jgi:erythromycin esterase-like protein